MLFRCLFSLLFIASGTLASAAQLTLQEQVRAEAFFNGCATLLQNSVLAFKQAKATGQLKKAEEAAFSAINLQARLLNGPTFADWRGIGNSINIGSENLPYLSGPTVANASDPKYLANAKSAHQAFKAQWKVQLASNGIEFEVWKENLRQLHLLMTGVANQNPHSHHAFGYQSDSCVVFPGQFRHELPEGTKQLVSTLDRESAIFVSQWMAAYGYPRVNTLRPYVIDVNGMAAFLDSSGAKLTTVPVEILEEATDGMQLYAHAKDVPLYMRVMWELQQQIADKIKLFAPDLQSKEVLLREVALNIVLDSIADYYQAAIYALPFYRVNNSIFLMQVNTFLETIGLLPIQHARLDMATIRMPNTPFRSYFKWYMRIYLIE